MIAVSPAAKPKRLPASGRTGSGRRRLRRAEREGQTRTCIGCRQFDQQENLLRVVAAPDGTIAFDLAGGTFGRGAWVHPRAECLSKSVKGLSHAFRAPIAVTAREMHECLVTTAWRRAEALVRSAKGAGRLHYGADAGANVWFLGKVSLVILAHDAQSTLDLSWVRAAQDAGRAIVGPSKSILGNWCGQELVAVAAIADAGLAKAIGRSMALAQMPSPTERRREAERGTEVG